MGSGPNGLTAAIMLAKAGLHTTVLEAEPVVGGGARSAELTLPGFVHDICSSVYPLAASSPAFDSFPLAEHGLKWVQPDIPVAHPLEDGSAAALYRSVDVTCEHLGNPDGPRYRGIVEPFVEHWSELTQEILGPVHFPTHPGLLARFGIRAMAPAAISARTLFEHERARALFAGIAAHSVLPLEAAASSAFAWVLAIAGHAVGWPFAKGGSQQVANALASYFRSLGGEIVLNTRVRSLREFRNAAVILLDITPKQFLEIAGDELPRTYTRQLSSFRYGPGVFKMDWALREPIPWNATECRRAGTVHVGGTFEEIGAAERSVVVGGHPERPFVLLAQPTLFDATRAPAGQHIAWAYCHVPNGSKFDMTQQIESQIERFAPGFRDTILARHTFFPADLEQHNANLVGGAIMGGSNYLKELLIRPTWRFYGTPFENVYLCSASTPPGGGVHGMCGFHAARVALTGLQKIAKSTTERTTTEVTV